MKMGANDKKKIPIVIHGNGILLTKNVDLTQPKEMLLQLEINISGMTISSRRENYSSFNFKIKKEKYNNSSKNLEKSEQIHPTGAVFPGKSHKS